MNSNLSDFLGHMAVHAQRFVVLDNGNHCLTLFELDSGVCIAHTGSRGEGAGQFQSLTGVAFNSRGEIYVSDSCLRRIQVFDENATYMRVFPCNTLLHDPCGLACTPTDQLVVCNGEKHQICVLGEDGVVLCAFGTMGAADGQFNVPRAVCVARDGRIIVLDSGNQGVQIFDQHGSFVRSIGSKGKRRGQFMWPLSIAMAPTGEIAVADFHQKRSGVQVFSDTGVLLHTLQCPIWGSDAGIRGVAMDAQGRLLVAYKNVIAMHSKL